MSTPAWSSPIPPFTARSFSEEPLATPATATRQTPSTPTTAAALLTIEEAAAHLNVSARYVRRLVAERRITFYRLGRCVRFRPSDLDAHIDAGRVEPITRASVWNDLRSVA